MNNENQDQNQDKMSYLEGEKLIALKQALLGIKVNVDKAINLLSADGGGEEGVGAALASSFGRLREMFVSKEDEGRVIEGVFDGQNMIGPDAKQYSVPANYASKSKLVEGDILKLTIAGNGSFVYKQIGPIERDRLAGVLGKSESTGEFLVYVDDRKWRVLPASVTYFKGDEGDEVVVLVPKDRPSKWAAIENIIKNVE
jgi:hypothetical protein